MTVEPGWAHKRPAAARQSPLTTEDKRRAPVSEERSPWNLNSDEQRTLIITFVGGLGSLILAAVIIGAGIAFVRSMNAHPGTSSVVLTVFLWRGLSRKYWGAFTCFSMGAGSHRISPARAKLGSIFTPCFGRWWRWHCCGTACLL
jgi:hypothetical protein